jgi:hypothetical protein
MAKQRTRSQLQPADSNEVDKSICFKELRMQRQLLISITALSMAFAAPAIAQESATPPTPAPPITVKNGGIAPQHLGLETVIGCLTETGGTYVITGGGGAGKQFRIVSGDVSSFKHAYGQDVEVVGIVAKNDPLENQNGLVNEGTTTGAGYLTIQAQKVKVIGAHCNLSGKEWEGDHMENKK